MRPPLLALLLGLVMAAAACRPGVVAPETRFALHQKGKFQALYDASGRMVRLLQDTNGDGRAEVVVVFGEKGKPERGEIDTDGDGVVDRREYFAPDGTLLRVETTDRVLPQTAAPSPAP